MSNVTWSNQAGGDFGTAANWAGGLPSSGSNVVISTTNVETITFQSPDNFTIGSLTVQADTFAVSGGTLNITTTASFTGEFSLSGGTMTVNSGTTFSDGYDQSGGTIDLLGSVSFAGETQLNGGTLTVAQGATFNSGFYQDGGTLAGTGDISISGTNALTGGQTAQLLDGNTEGALQITNNGTMTVADYTFGGATQFVNNSVLDESGEITLGDTSAIDATIDNTSNGTFNIAGDYGISGGANSASFVNAGLLEKTSGTNTSDISVSISSTGTIDAASGTLAFSGPTSSFGGTIEGAGTFEISGGDATILSGATISVAAFAVSGATVTLDENLTYAGTFSLDGGSSTLYLDGDTLTLSGTTTLAGTVDSSGTLITSGSDALDGLTLGGTVLWKNTGSVSQSGTTTIGDGSNLAAEIINEAGGVFNLVNNSGINIGTSSASEFVNDGTLKVTNSGGGTSAINASITSPGTIDVVSGIAQFNGTGDVLGGTIEGAGTVQFGGGTDTISSGTAVTVAALTISGATVTLDENLAYVGTVALQSGALDLNGVSLTLSGSASLSGTIDGTGTLITNDSPTLSGFTLGGTTKWQNNGTVNQTGTTTIGDNAGNTAEIVNEGGGTYILANDSAINLGASLASKFLNDGTLEIVAQSGTSNINTAITSTGTIDVVSGTAQFNGTGNVLGGTIEGASGTLLFGGGTDAISKGTKVTVGALTISGSTTVTLDESLAYAGTFSLNGGSSVLDLNGNQLTLSGTTTTPSILTGTVNGNGTLITNGSSTLSGLTLGGTTTWENDGTVTQNATTTIGDGAGHPAEIVNEAKATYIIANDSAINLGASLASKFVNDGTLEITAQSGTSDINTPFISTGTIDVVSGTGIADFTGTGNVLGGTLEGAGTLQLGGGTDTISKGTKVTVGALTISGSTTVTFDESLTYGGTFALNSGASVLNLNGNSLTLSGTTTLAGTIDGSGTVITDAGTALNGLSLGGTTKWQNNASVQQNATTTIGDSSGDKAEIVNEAKGVYIIVNDSGINIGTSLLSEFLNEGLLEINAKTGTSVINAAVTSTGTIDVLSGTIQFNGTDDVFGGKIEGAGTVQLSNGQITISKGTAVTVSALAITGSTTVTLGENLAYGGAFSLGGGSSVINLNGDSLTLTGTSILAGTIDGKGTLVTNGGSTLSGLTLGGTATWQNNGTVKQTNTATIGDSSGTAAEIVNEAKGIYNIVNDSGINIGASIASQFINDGLLEITAGSGTSAINADVTSTGTIDILSGTAQFNGIADSFGGLIEGGGIFQLGSGTATIANGAKLTVASLVIDNSASVKLGESLTYAGKFAIQNSSSSSSLTLTGETLTLTGTATLNGASIVGAGTLITKSTTNLDGVTFGGTTSWDNYGRVYENTNFNLGQSGTVTTTITNEAGAVFDLIADVGIGGGNDNAGEFYNAGTLEKTGSTGTSTIYVGVDNTGTLYADSGTLNITGTITGTGNLKVGSVGNVTQDILELGGSVAKTQEVTFVGSNSALELSDTSGFDAKGIAGFAAGDSIDLTGFGYSSTEKVKFTENAGKTAGELVVTDGTQSFSVELFGQYANDFHLAADGSGTAITYVPPGSHSTTPHLAATHT